DRSGRVNARSKVWEDVIGLDWAGNGGEVRYSAARSGSSKSLFAMTLDGRERLLLRIPGSVRLLDGRGPRLLIARDEFRVCVYGRAPGETRERDLSWMDWSLVDDLTPDGRRIVLTEQGGETGPNYAVCVRSTAGGPILRVGEGVGGSISPDGRWVVTLNRPQG